MVETVVLASGEGSTKGTKLSKVEVAVVVEFFSGSGFKISADDVADTPLQIN